MLPGFRECIMLSAILITVACAGGEQYTVDISAGGYLTGEQGMTLYYSLNDAPGNGISNCIDECSSLWPPFYADLILVPSGLSTSDFATISRTDGRMQTTYKGWPLYKYAEDKKPGDIIGDKANEIWFVIYPDKFPPT
jgi:predicted lipoprotein with Yx(FWY)xxD motif